MKPFAIVDESSLDHERWHAFIRSHPRGSIFHTPEMLEVFRHTYRNTPLFLAAIDSHGEILALLLAVRVQTLPDPLGNFSSRSIFYAEPICREDDDGVDALTELIRLHDRIMAPRVLFTEIRPLWPSGNERDALERCDYDYKGYLNYIADLTQSPDQIWNRMIKSCRADVRRSTKRGLRVEEYTTEEGIDLLYHFCTLSYERSRVPLADKSMFTSAFRILKPHDMIKVFVAYHNDTPVAADVMLVYKQMVFAWYGGLERIKGISPVECLTWHELEWGSKNNYEVYDFGGAGWPGQPYGVRDFKAKFGGDLVNYGRYRKIYSPCTLALAEYAYETRRKLLQRRNAWLAQRKSPQET